LYAISSFHNHTLNKFSLQFQAQPDDEDIHTANERRLSELIGPLGGKLHTGRSRNDQVATDMRLWLLEEVQDIEQSVKGLLQVIVDRADKEKEILLPGYTHLQVRRVSRLENSNNGACSAANPYDGPTFFSLMPRHSVTTSNVYNNSFLEFPCCLWALERWPGIPLRSTGNFLLES
jgi:hypothetical protein